MTLTHSKNNQTNKQTNKQTKNNKLWTAFLSGIFRYRLSDQTIRTGDSYALDVLIKKYIETVDINYSLS